MDRTAVEPRPGSRPIARLRSARAAGAPALLVLLVASLALQRGGSYPESLGLPTAGCAIAVALRACRPGLVRLRRLEITHLAGLALLGGLALASSAWAPGGLGSALPQSELVALYLAAAWALLAVFARGMPIMLAVWLAVVGIASFGLVRHLFPDTLAGLDPAAQNRMYRPLGYWNSLGLWAAMGLCLAAILVARSSSRALRAAAAASTVPLAVTLYLTFSRGSVASLAIGLGVALLLDPRRLGLLAWLIASALWPALGVLVASHESAFTRPVPVLAASQHDGRQLALWIVVLALASAVATVLLVRLEPRVARGVVLRRGFAVGVLAVLASLVVLGVVKEGAPWSVAKREVTRFSAAPSSDHPSGLNTRLLSGSGSYRTLLWRVAWHDFTAHPAVGSGAGSFEARWYRYRSYTLDASHAHELYLETLAELGPLGLALLLVSLGAPLVAAWRARRHPLAAGATAAYVAFLAHVAADRDWQVAAVGLVAIASAATLLVLARETPSAPAGTAGRTCAALAGGVLALFALWGLWGAYPLGQARDAAAAQDWTRVESEAARAVRRRPGSSSLAWQLLGEAQSARGAPAAARASLRVAVARDPDSWAAWRDLADVSSGDARRAAARHALVLNPRDPGVQSLARTLGLVD